MEGRIPVDNPTVGKNPQLNNNFDYGPRGVTPRTQSLCPFAAHTRKTGPRTDIPLAIDEQHAIRRGGTPVHLFATIFLLTSTSQVLRTVLNCHTGRWIGPFTSEVYRSFLTKAQ
jgi:hypothetical protein